MYSNPSDGTNTTAPQPTAMISATRVERPAAACTTVSPGSNRGACPAAHPTTTAATASAAVTRASPNRYRQHRSSVASPAAAETQTSPSATPWVRFSPDRRMTSSPASASAPQTSPAASARRRKAAASAARSLEPSPEPSAARSESAARYTAARYPENTTASAPISTQAGFSHDVTGFPSAFPSGTRPMAIAPTAVPSANGVSTDDSANKYSANRDQSRAPRSA